MRPVTHAFDMLLLPYLFLLNSVLYFIPNYTSTTNKPHINHIFVDDMWLRCG